jgi:hypothetical protein
MYKLVKSIYTQKIESVQKQDGGVFYSIPFAPDNTDYQTFKKEVLAGAELQDSDGVVMTQEQANEFINTLP